MTTSTRVAILTTHIANEYLVIRANPDEKAVLSFVEEHNARYHRGEPGGPSGEPAFLVKAAHYFEAEPLGAPDFTEGTEIDLSAVLDSGA